MLDAMFHARSVAVIGASKGTTETGGAKLGAAALNYLVDHGFDGPIFPVNPRYQELAGRRCYANVRDIEEGVDLALIVLRAEACPDAMADCAAKGVKVAVVYAAGFAEAGDRALQDRLLGAARAGGVRLCGPNTNGFINAVDNLVCCTSSVSDMNPFPGGDIAFIGQSGALGGSMLGCAMEEGSGFSYSVTTGNEADLGAADYLDYLIDDDRAKVFALFLEGVGDAPKFLAAAGKAARARKPIVVYKVGLSDIAAEACASHTGALAGSDRVFDAVCRQYGLIRVDDLAELLPTATAFSWIGDKLPRGNRVGIVSASGGISGVAADECHRFGLEIPELDAEAKARIGEFVPSFGSVRNPVDLTQQVRSRVSAYSDAARALLDLDTIDGVMLFATMVGEPRASVYGEEFSTIAREASKPVIVGWAGPPGLASKGFPMLQANRTPTFRSVRGAVKAMRRLYDYRTFLERFAREAAE